MSKFISAAELLSALDTRGWLEVSSGMWLHTQEDLVQWQDENEDEAQGLDFTTAPYWMANDAGHVAPIYCPNDRDLMELIRQD